MVGALTALTGRTLGRSLEVGDTGLMGQVTAIHTSRGHDRIELRFQNLSGQGKGRHGQGRACEAA